MTRYYTTEEFYSSYQYQVEIPSILLVYINIEIPSLLAFEMGLLFYFNNHCFNQYCLQNSLALYHFNIVIIISEKNIEGQICLWAIMFGPLLKLYTMA